MSLNDVLMNRQPANTAAPDQCTRCRRTEPLGWSPVGPACGACARAIYQANIDLANLSDAPPIREETPWWTYIVWIKLALLLIVMAYRFSH